MSPNTKAQKQAKRQQEDAIFNRILVWFGGAIAAEIVLFIANRLLPDFALIRWLTVLVPVVMVLALVYYLFQRDFFYIALITAGGILSLNLYRRMIVAHPFRLRCGYVLAFVLLAAALVLTILLQRKGGVLTLSGRELHILPKEANYPLLYVACVLNAVLLAVTLVQGSAAAYYLMFILVGWLFVMAVYYIVKLM